MNYLFAHRRYSLPFRAPVRTAHGPWKEREGVLVRLEDESGAVGFGEAAPLAWFGTETVDDVEAVCVELGERVSDERLDSIPENCGCLRFALASARKVGGPAAVHPYLPVAALLPAGRAVLERVRVVAEAGFRNFKWKVGVGDAADEMAMLDDVIGELPKGGQLRLDANGAWERRQAERWLERCAERPIEFVEQPVSPDARNANDLLRGLAENFPTPLALDESVTRARDIDVWLDMGWPGLFVIKPLLLGDADGALKRLSKAKARVVFSSALETALGAKAALRMAFAYGGEARALGFGVWPLFEDGRFDGPHAAPFIRSEDVERIDAEAIWNALS